MTMEKASALGIHGISDETSRDSRPGAHRAAGVGSTAKRLAWAPDSGMPVTDDVVEHRYTRRAIDALLTFLVQNLICLESDLAVASCCHP